MEQFEREQIEREAEEMTSLHYLTKDNAVFERTKGGFVRRTFDGKTWERVQVIRLFPSRTGLSLSEPWKRDHGKSVW